MHHEQMLKTHPAAGNMKISGLAACIDACYDCAQTCIACADACVAEKQPDMLNRCIRLNLDCAAICTTTGQILSRATEPSWALIRQQVQACATACAECASECEKHASHMEHCRVCAEACRACQRACEQILASFAPESK